VLGKSDKPRLLVVLVTERDDVIHLISVRKRPAVSEGTMKKARHRKTPVGQLPHDEVLPEYDFSRSRPNKYAAGYRQGSLVVTLDPDVAAIFPGAREANEALRALAGVIRSHKTRRPSRRSA
jgi:hypothetical protein